MNFEADRLTPYLDKIKGDDDEEAAAVSSEGKQINTETNNLDEADYSEVLKDVPNAEAIGDSLRDNTEESSINEKSVQENEEPLGAAENYARDLGKDISDNESNSVNGDKPEDNKVDNINQEDPRGLKEAYAKSLGIDISDNESAEALVKSVETIVQNTETKKEIPVESVETTEEEQSFESIGAQKWEAAFKKVGNFASSLYEKGKKAINIATGVAFEAPAIIEESVEVTVTKGQEAYVSAKETFDNTVDSARKKANEIKANLVEGIKNAKENFLNKIIGTKDKYINQATALRNMGIKWGIDKSTEVTQKITKDYEDFQGRVIKAQIAINAEKIVKGIVEKDRIAEKPELTKMESKKISGIKSNVEVYEKRIGELIGKINEKNKKTKQTIALAQVINRATNTLKM